MSRADAPPERPADAELAHAFAAHAVGWARELGAPAATLEPLRAAAARASLAVAEGDVCVPLDALATPERGAAALRDALLASGIVGCGDDPIARPLVLDAADRLYLRRHFDWERRLARALAGRALAPPIPAPPDTRERLDALFAANAARLDGRADWQKLAVALALERRLAVISGGPGTGKTTTVAALLACLLGADPALRVALAAPTGKAAARMLDALRARAALLPDDVRARLPQTAHTLHRLLGVTPRAGRFRHDAANPLPLDVLVVDEASMLDLALAARLVDALPRDARLILLGDKDQLAAVEAGAVFAELSADPTLTAAAVARLATLTTTSASRIVAPAPRAPSALADGVVWFADSHRFAADSGIGRLAAGISAGDGGDTLAWLRDAADPTVAWVDDAGGPPSPRTFAALDDGYAGYVAALAAYDGDPAPVFAAFDRFRVLCAVHDGPRGVAAINERMSRAVRALPGHAGEPASPWYPGRPVIVLRNDYVMRLYNGDVGICLAGDDGAPRVVFADADGGWRAVAPLRLPRHDTAFAMTVHKSQGSEFGAVLVLLPATPVRVATRELLYTAVTRASREVVVAGSEEVFVAACATPTLRASGLRDRLREAVGDARLPSVAS